MGRPREDARDDLQAQALELDWPTPQAADSERSSATLFRSTGNPTLLGAARKNWSTPQTRVWGAHTQANGSKTPFLGNQAQDWATPDASVSTGYNQSDSPNAAIRPRIGRMVQEDPCGHPAGETPPGPTSPPSTGRPQLNPAFVEWLMGVPDGWTASELSEMALSPWWQQWRSEYWRIVRGLQ
jgi:hypothetical protein